MTNFLIVSKADGLSEYSKIAAEYGVGYEYNDFFNPEVLDDAELQDSIINKYRESKVPEYCTMHGAFFDVIPFSYDSRIRAVSEERMIQSMEIARRIGAKAVVFHTNANPFLTLEKYIEQMVLATSEFVGKLLDEYRDINIYLENMFDSSPDILRKISEQLVRYPNYGICFDYAHASISPTPIDVWVESIGKYVRHIHINDNDLKNDLHLAVGTGKIDWERFRIYYYKYFRECTVLIETDSPANQVKSLKYIRTLLDMDSSEKRSVKDMVLKKYISGAEEMMESIFHYMTELLEEKKFSNTVGILTELGSTIANADRASFWFWDKQDKQYWTLAATGNDRIAIPEGTGIVGKTIQEDKVIITNNPYEEDFFNPEVDKKTGYKSKSILCIPVENTSGEVVGAFQVLNKFDENGDDGLFDNGDARRLTLVAAFCEKTLESYMLYNEAMVDELTKLPNRYAFYEYYNKKVVKFMEDRDMWVIMCDIDHFKMVNDTYGHNNGDFILKNVAAILNESVSEDNIVVRWGGEEFVFIVSGSNLEEVKQFADSIRKDIEKHEFNTGKEIINITMSFGVSRADKNVTIEENVHRADDRLYMAKDSGRNRVV